MILRAKSTPDDKYFFEDIAGHKGKENVLTIGAGSYIGDAELSVFAENLNSPHILAGRFCSLADKIYFAIGGNHNYKNVTTFPFDVAYVVKRVFGSDNLLPYNRPNHFQIVIGSDVWIGRGVTIMGGVKIGNGALIGSSAVVAKDIPPYAIVVGNPARIVKYRFDEVTIKKFLAVKWWSWDLEKIADNLPLMTDVEKFLATHYSPALTEFPEDEFSRQINSAAKFGGRVYHFIADFQVPNPLWVKVVTEFGKADFKNKLLVIWLPKDSTAEDSLALTEAIGDNENILMFRHDKNFSPGALRQGTHFITTREMTTLAALDYLWGTGVKIVSALANEIFA